jgi:hypothetical protein
MPDGKKNYENTLKWLLEPEDIGVRYLVLRDLVQADEKEFRAARENAHREGLIAQILDRMHPEGYWEQPGAGYYPKYTGTGWSVIMLSQLGASANMDERIEKACAYLLENNLTQGGQFSVNGTPSGTADCMQGNYCAAFLDLGYTDPRLDKAFEWMARSVTGEGVAPMGDKTSPVRYYAGKGGPHFACGSNNKLP